MVAGIARIFFWGYAAMLLGVGASGVFVARWELTRVFSMSLVAGTTVAATMLNQYRILKAMEFAFVVFAALELITRVFAWATVWGATRSAV